MPHRRISQTILIKKKSPDIKEYTLWDTVARICCEIKHMWKSVCGVTLFLAFKKVKTMKAAFPPEMDLKYRVWKITGYIIATV